MRIVIDMQGAQTESRFRGIGRYTMSLGKAIVRNRGEHEVILALNGLFPDTIEPIRAAFDGLLPQENIRVWSAVSPLAGIDERNDWRRQSAEFIREAFLASLKPDVIHVSSLFEGLEDDAVTSVGALSQTIPTAVTLYDLIPYIHRSPYLENPSVKAWYLGKIEHLRRANLWLAISESSRQEGIDHLNLQVDRSVNISTDADAHFLPLNISTEREKELRQKYGLFRPFLMYTGGIDYRKNIDALIRAFTNLPTSLRKNHQLAIVCSASPESRHILEQLAAQQGLSKDELVLTGFVPENDLVDLYNLCALFVFPSWHEGFGLPALEAMRCGAPVIGANTSSLPEVIGWNEAMFDPRSDEAMAETIEHALTDVTFRAELIDHGKKQSARFSWDKSARLAIEAMEHLHVTRKGTPKVHKVGGRRPRLAYVSPLPPEKSGIADYSAELLPELARLYKIDIIVAQDAISDPWLMANCPVRTVQWFIENSGQFERVLYHFGNSPFHKHMFALMEVIPGVVVLHDFFLSGIICHIDWIGLAPGYWTKELYKSHGYKALSDRSNEENNEDIIWKYPCSLSVIQASLGIITHSPNSLSLVEKWFGSEYSDFAVIPLLRNSRINSDKDAARKALGFKVGDFLVCTFGMLVPTKLNHRLLQAWLGSSLGQDKSCHLVFVGENHPGDYGQELLAAIHRTQAPQNIHIVGWTKQEIFCQYLAAADVGVQLRTLSRGETSAAVLDCMNYGLPTIVNAHGAMADLDEKTVWKLPDEFSDEQLINALEILWKDEDYRLQLGENARKIILREHEPSTCSNQYREEIERFYQSVATGLLALPKAIADIPSRLGNDAELMQLAGAMVQNFPPRNRQRQLLIDISVLIQSNAHSGIQRVVRSILSKWLNNPPTGYRVEPVYTTVDLGYRYARQFTIDFLCCPDDVLLDEPMEYSSGDVFFGLDLTHQLTINNENYLNEMNRAGVRIIFMVYDLLPIQFPQYWEPHIAIHLLHQQWLKVITKYDCAVCISKAVADELTFWVKENGSPRERSYSIEWFHLGADFDNSTSTKGVPAEASTILTQLRNNKSFLMVGTLEPRKGHAQVLDTFEQLWKSDININLVIVGKEGWMVENLVNRLRTHRERNKRLFWLKGISDEYLEKVYTASTCMIAASYGEGFGLPLIEAAQHKLPIIARDIPVFREVAGEYAYYFDSKDPSDLTMSIIEWLRLNTSSQHPVSDNMPWLTWKESADQLMQIITKRDSQDYVANRVHEEQEKLDSRSNSD